MTKAATVLDMAVELRSVKNEIRMIQKVLAERDATAQAHMDNRWRAEQALRVIEKVLAEIAAMPYDHGVDAILLAQRTLAVMPPKAT